MVARTCLAVRSRMMRSRWDVHARVADTRRSSSCLSAKLRALAAVRPCPPGLEGC